MRELGIRPSVLHRWRNYALARLRRNSTERAAERAKELKHRAVQAENEKLKAALAFFARMFGPKGRRTRTNSGPRTQFRGADGGASPCPGYIAQHALSVCAGAIGCTTALGQGRQGHPSRHAWHRHAQNVGELLHSLRSDPSRGNMLCPAPPQDRWYNTPHQHRIAHARI